MTEPPTGEAPRPPDDTDHRAARGTGRQLVRSSALVGLGTALSRITGFLRVSAIAAIGFTRLTDVYNIANSTPNIVYELLLGGILTATLVPLYVQYLERQDEDAADAINTVALVALLVISVLGFLLAPWIIQLYTLRLSGAGRAEQQELATFLLRLFMPQIFFYGLTALGEAMLNARRRFGVAAFVPVVNNLVVIAVFLALPRLTDDLTVAGVNDDTGLALLLGLGTTAGVVAMALVLLPALRHLGVRFRLNWNWRHPAVRQVARLSGWTFGYVATNQIAFWIALFLAYGKSGDASVYLAAFTFFQLPHGLFSVSIMVALGPVLAAHANRGDLTSFRSAFTDGFRLMTLVVLPASGVMIVLAGPIVNAVLGYGDFTAASARATAGTLAAFGVGLLFFSAYLYTLRAFYAMQDTRTPFFLNCLENGLNIVLAFVLYPWLGVRGLALAWSLAYAAASIVALRALRRRVGSLDGRRNARAIGRIALAGVVSTAVVGAIGLAMPHDSTGGAVVTCVVALGLGGGVYLLGLRLLHVPEVAMLRDAMRRSPATVPAGVPDEGPADA